MVAFLLLLLPFVLTLGMQRELSHDEHQFIASGALLARKGLLPYRDYPYFHMPGLTLLYAGVFRLTPYLLLAARACSVVAGTLTLSAVLYLAMDLLAGQPPGLRLAASAGAAVLLLTNPLFVFTTGRAWNHDLSVLLALAAFACHCRAVWRDRGPNWLFASGVCLGLA